MAQWFQQQKAAWEADPTKEMSFLMLFLFVPFNLGANTCTDQIWCRIRILDGIRPEEQDTDAHCWDLCYTLISAALGSALSLVQGAKTRILIGEADLCITKKEYWGGAV